MINRTQLPTPITTDSHPSLPSEENEKSNTWSDFWSPYLLKSDKAQAQVIREEERNGDELVLARNK